MAQKQTPDHAAAARIANLAESNRAIKTVFSDENLAAVDRAIKAQVKAGGAAKAAAWQLVQVARDLGVPARDGAACKLIHAAISEHAISVFGDDPQHPGRVAWGDWSKCIQRAVYHAVPEDKFGISLKNNPDYKIGASKGAQTPTAGKVQQTTLFEMHKTLSKVLTQARLLNQLDFAGALLDLVLDQYPEFKEVTDDGKVVGE